MWLLWNNVNAAPLFVKFDGILVLVLSQWRVWQKVNLSRSQVEGRKMPASGGVPLPSPRGVQGGVGEWKELI